MLLGGRPREPPREPPRALEYQAGAFAHTCSFEQTRRLQPLEPVVPVEPEFRAAIRVTVGCLRCLWRLRYWRTVETWICERRSATSCRECGRAGGCLTFCNCGWGCCHSSFVFVRDGRPHNQGSCSVGDCERLGGRSDDCFSTVTGCTHFLDSKVRLASAKAGV